MDALRGNVLFPFLVVWAAITAVLVILFLWRGALQTHEDDQVFLDAAEDRMAAEQRALVARIDKLSKPIHYLMFASGGLLVIMAAIWLWQVYQTF